MRVSPTLVSIIIAGIIFVFATYLPTSLLNVLAGTRIGAAAMLIAILVIVKYDVIVALSASLAVAAIFVEYRRRVVVSIRNSLVKPGQPDSVQNIGSTHKLLPVEAHPSPEEPSVSLEEMNHDIPTSEREPLDTIEPSSNSIGELMEKSGFASLLH